MPDDLPKIMSTYRKQQADVAEHPNHKHGDTYDKALQPGFFNWDGLPTKREHYAGTPKFFNGAEWLFVDEGKFAHEARRVSEAEFKEDLALRKQQHEEFMKAKEAEVAGSTSEPLPDLRNEE